MQYDCCVYPYKKREKHQGCVHIEKRPLENKARGGHLQTQERGLKRNQTNGILVLDLQPPNL